MARRTAKLGRLLAGLFVVLLLYLAGVQVIWGPELADSPQNPRLAIASEQIQWGRVLDRHLAVLADSVTQRGRQVRRYTDGPLYAPLVGYRSSRYGLAGLEARYDPELLGLPATDPWGALQNALGRPPHGDDLVLTVDATVQQQAAQALGNNRGAAVVLDPRTGAVLALVSRPTFDPASVDPKWLAISRDPVSPLLNRATSGQYPPGSSFKPVVLAAALAGGRTTQQTAVDCAASVSVDGAVITNFEHERYGPMTVAQAFAVSCNVAFVHLGLATGADAILRTARAFGLGEAPRFDLPTASGYLPDPRLLNRRGLAQISFGQGSLLVTPLQMAVVAATIANRGVAMRPFVLSQVRAPDGRVLASYAQHGGRDVLAPAIASEIAADMVEVVRSGTGTAAQLPGVVVAGKTGTAENPHGQTHAWFIAFAPADHPTVAIALLLENAGVGGQVAAPAARQVLAAALRAQAAEASRP
ncbi:MAG TPA: penicillin-binding transpeptidase domain-containing protein [bacterium]|nr:penicillin-binding transpeptidase domain-containing protein [bacterium]